MLAKAYETEGQLRESAHLISLGKDGVNLGGILSHEGAHKVLEQVCSTLCLRQDQPQQENTLELIVEGNPEKLLND